MPERFAIATVEPAASVGKALTVPEGDAGCGGRLPQASWLQYRAAGGVRAGEVYLAEADGSAADCRAESACGNALQVIKQGLDFRGAAERTKGALAFLWERHVQLGRLQEAVVVAPETCQAFASLETEPKYSETLAASRKVKRSAGAHSRSRPLKQILRFRRTRLTLFRTE